MVGHVGFCTNKGNIINEFTLLHFYILKRQSFLVVMKGPFLLRVMRVMMSMIVVKVGGVFVF